MIAVLALLLLGQGSGEDGSAVLERVRTEMAKHSSASLTVEMKQGANMEVLKVRMLRPGAFELVSPKFETHSDGKKTFYFDAEQKIYQEMGSADPSSSPAAFLFGLEGVVGLEPQPYRATGKAKAGFFRGKPAMVLRLEHPQFPGEPVLLYVSNGSLAPLGWETSSNGTQNFVAYKDLKLGEPMKAETFAWTPPEGARNAAELSPAEQPSAPLGPPPLEVGSAAPDFTLKTPEGKDVTLSAVVKANKATVVTFWFKDCVYCNKEFPILNGLYKQLKPQGLEMIGVNTVDEAKDTRDHATKAGLKFPVVRDGTGAKEATEAYNIWGFPTNYVIDAKGKIVAAVVGYDPAKLQETLKQMGFKFKPVPEK